MILELFVTLLALSVALVAFGYYTGDRHHALVGFFFFFLLGMYIILGQLQYSTGVTVDVINSTTTTITNNYTTYSDIYTHLFGYFFAIAGAFGASLTLYNWRVDR